MGGPRPGPTGPLHKNGTGGESGSQLPASGTREYQIISKEMKMKVVVSRYTG